MILSILKLVVTVITAVLSVMLFVAKVVWNVVSDGAAQAKEATPGVVSALKAESKATAAKAPAIANKVEEDLRRMTKISKRIAEKRLADIDAADAAASVN